MPSHYKKASKKQKPNKPYTPPNKVGARGSAQFRKPTGSREEQGRAQRSGGGLKGGDARKNNTAKIRRGGAWDVFQLKQKGQVRRGTSAPSTPKKR